MSAIDEPQFTPRQMLVGAIPLAIGCLLGGYLICYTTSGKQRQAIQSLSAEKQQLVKDNEMHVAKWAAFEELVRRQNQMSIEATQLLQEAAASQHGVIVLISSRRIRVGFEGNDKTDRNDPRSYAVWKSALDELLSRGYVELSDSHYNQQPFRSDKYQVTKSG
jgi:hypothetical protein